MLLLSVIDTPLHLEALLATAGGEKNITVYPVLVEGIDLVYVPFDICTGNLVA